MFSQIYQTPSIQWNNKFKHKLAITRDERLRQFYQQDLPQPNTPISEVKFVAVDFETTGLDPETNDIISIGLVPFTLNRIYLKQAKQWMVQPQGKLTEESVIIHGITHSELEGAPDLDHILEELLPALTGYIPVVHYRTIERYFLDNALRSRIGEGIEFPVLDTLNIELNIQRNKIGFWQRLKGYSVESLRLAQSRRRYNLPDYTPHHALTDAIATAELLQAQMAHYYKPTTPIKRFWL
ncbi:3'-5' exonuclease [Vibrio sp.]|nr:3'-5' exonuclease [Vibrio sp.]